MKDSFLEQKKINTLLYTNKLKKLLIYVLIMIFMFIQLFKRLRLIVYMILLIIKKIY